MDKHPLELSPNQLRCMTDPAQFSFETTQDLPPLQQIIGQERAVRAIDFGIDIPNHGYNIYAVGPAGSGRTTVVRQFLDRRAPQRPVPPEWCYVYNFEDPRRPRAISLPSGRAAEFRDDMARFLQQLQQDIPRAFEGEFYEQRRREILLDLQQKQQELYEGLESYLNERGFALIRSQMGLAIAPVLNGQTLSAEDYDKLDPETKKQFEAHRRELQEQYDKTMREIRDLDRRGRGVMENVTQELARFVINNLLDDLQAKYQEIPKVLAYLTAVREDMVQNVASFLPKSDEEKAAALMMGRAGDGAGWFNRYKINVLADTCDGHCAPVVIEDSPTYPNLIGRIEHRAEFGAMVTDFTQVRSGALHRANGGYLVVEAKNLLANPLAWDGLKRALHNHQIKIEEMAQFYGVVATVSLEPEPIPLDVKVIIIGDERLYEALYSYDEDFRELFKVKAQFVPTMKLDTNTAQDYAVFIGDLVRREGLCHFDRTAVARIIDEAARQADDQHKVTTRFADVASLVREASFWAGRADREVVTADDVRRAMDERTHSLDYIAEAYRERIQEGVVLIDTAGKSVGQINGLSVIQMSNFEFGVPSRITAKTFMGRGGIASIDREVKMSGPIHDKGQLILSSYLASRFAQERPLSVSCSLTFEQLYSGVEGDSASSTELYALLSSLSDVPIKQSLAVTGSVNQSGQVQAIGGVNAKIEGFYDLCQARGLTGEQGVLIPASNVRHLMLREDVIQAVAEGRFHIYAVSTIEQGIELLTGIPAGEADEEGHYPEGTVYALVWERLNKYAELAEGKDEPEPEEEELKNPDKTEEKKEPDPPDEEDSEE